VIDVADLKTLEEKVGQALRTRDEGQLRLLGHGEVSITLGWPTDHPQFACKRLPPFDSVEACTEYASVVNNYIEELRERGVRVVDTDVQWFRRQDGRIIAFHIQPALPPETLGLDVLRRSAPAADHPFVASVVDVVADGTSERVGIDAQFSNWSWTDGEPWQFDLTTPFMIREDGEPAFDLTPFLAGLPSVIRPVIRREMVKLIRRWLTPRGSLLDLAANTIKAGLDDWIDPVLERINERVDPPITHIEAMRVYRSDRRMFPFLLQAERVDRFWQERIRQRPYEFLLPKSTTYRV
jgi:Family of unknown function (DUF6206)